MKCFFRINAAILILLLPSYSLAASLEKIRVGQTDDRTRVVFEIKDKERVRYSQLTNPPRIVVVFYSAENNLTYKRRNVDGQFIKKIRIANKAKKIRVVLDLKADFKFSQYWFSENQKGHERFTIDLYRKTNQSLLEKTPLERIPPPIVSVPAPVDTMVKVKPVMPTVPKTENKPVETAVTTVVTLPPIVAIEEDGTKKTMLTTPDKYSQKSENINPTKVNQEQFLAKDVIEKPAVLDTQVRNQPKGMFGRFINSLYIGFGGGVGYLTPEVTGVKEQTSTAMGISLGSRINESFAIELAYHDLGKARFENTTSKDIELKATSLAVTYRNSYLSETYQPYLSLGGRYLESNYEVDGEYNGFAGVGVEVVDIFNLDNTDLRLSYEVYSTDTSAALLTINVGF